MAYWTAPSPEPDAPFAIVSHEESLAAAQAKPGTLTETAIEPVAFAAAHATEGGLRVTGPVNAAIACITLPDMFRFWVKCVTSGWEKSPGKGLPPSG